MIILWPLLFSIFRFYMRAAAILNYMLATWDIYRFNVRIYTIKVNNIPWDTDRNRFGIYILMFILITRTIDIWTLVAMDHTKYFTECDLRKISLFFTLYFIAHFEGILPKGPYPIGPFDRIPLICQINSTSSTSSLVYLSFDCLLNKRAVLNIVPIPSCCGVAWHRYTK